jgi:ApaG protein
MAVLTSKTTNGITVSVESFYQYDYSRPIENKYIFAYRISIENNSDFTVQLMTRHWFVHDSNGVTREVEGEGVIGLLPILARNESHQYISWAHLFTEMGKMHGYYTFIRQIDGESFRVIIPEFHLVAPYKLN